jgi:hypothetical protein
LPTCKPASHQPVYLTSSSNDACHSFELIKPVSSRATAPAYIVWLIIRKFAYLACDACQLACQSIDLEDIIYLFMPA